MNGIYPRTRPPVLTHAPDGHKKADKPTTKNKKPGGKKRMLSGVCTINTHNWRLTGRVHPVSRYLARAR
jgi:hypothetical protein